MISEYLRDSVRRHPDAPAIVDGDQRISYAELTERVQAVRAWLRQTLDPKPGEVVAVSLDNSWQFVACFFAVCELGCALMPCNPQWRAAELRALAAGRLGFRGAVIEPRFSPEWHDILDVIPINRVLTADRMPAQRDPAGTPILPPVDSISKSTPALYVATSGSTGAPHLVPRTPSQCNCGGRRRSPERWAWGQAAEYWPWCRFTTVTGSTRACSPPC